MHLAISLLGYAPPARPWHGDYCAGIVPALLKLPEIERAMLLVTPYGHRHWQHLADERVQLVIVEGLDERKRRRFYAERYVLPAMLRSLAPDAVFAPLGGSLLQREAIQPECLEFVPPEADVNINRITPSAFGAGLVEAIKPQDITRRETSPPPGVSGRAHRVHAAEVEVAVGPAHDLVAPPLEAGEGAVEPHRRADHAAQ